MTNLSNFSFSFPDSTTLTPQLICEINTKEVLQDTYGKSQVFLYATLLYIAMKLIEMNFNIKNKVVLFLFGVLEGFWFVYSVVWVISMLSL